MGQELEEPYFNWLYSLVVSSRVKKKSLSFVNLMKLFHKTEFVWLVERDDNRSEDGKELRYEFLDHHILTADQEWMELGCSFFEMLIAISRRMAFETDEHPKDCFWELLRNLELDGCHDGLERFPEEEVTNRVMVVIWRTYLPNGSGGLFPLQNPREDQTQIELWYQLSAYVIEKGVG